MVAFGTGEADLKKAVGVARNIMTGMPGVLSLVVGIGVAACSSSEASRAEDEGSGGAGGQSASSVVYTELRSDVAYDATPAVSDEEYASVLAAANDLGLSMLARVGNANQNAILSPTSLEFALGMLTAGAESSTLQQILTRIGGGVEEEVLHAALNRLGAELRSRRIESQVEIIRDQKITQRLEIQQANGLWLKGGLTVEPGFLDRLAKNYNTGTKLIDFANPGAAEAVNSWVEENTEGTLRELVSQDSLADTVVLLTDALCFFASWARPFDPRLNENKAFHSPGGAKTVEMVHDINSFAYAHGEDWQMFDVPYVAGHVVFSLILPDAGAFETVRGRLDDAWLVDARAAMAAREIDLTLPMFDFEQESTSLRPALEELGLVEPFDCALADFSRIVDTEPLCLGSLPQAARIGLDEMGTTASAATAVDVQTIGDLEPTSPTLTLVVDRPFVFLVRDSSGALLFVGQVLDPVP